MKAWNFQVKSSPKEIGEKLESSLGSAGKFVFDINDDKINSVRFKLRKRMLLGFELNSQNHLTVNGKILKAGTGNKADVNIHFTPHILSKLVIFANIILGLCFLAAVILEVNSHSYMFIIGAIFLVTGILIALHLQRKFKEHVQEYKTLLSDVLKF
ncbi:DUF423 domain-containing protein [Zunongwangia sp. F260]|uniref:DUF423 domain-containing protein n=1 Tax=Autumnicola lenta TaxID=3075593 RepID=A0ABU3CGH1_9FLAO|nr:DUF423 domain-containing protein [Zunongwangia sp. F260]MDT0645434.1 DUF423 domain-containing protein [Zunongwangia sp. F260]